MVIDGRQRAREKRKEKRETIRRATECKWANEQDGWMGGWADIRLGQRQRAEGLAGCVLVCV
jgi:hypothetical protein